MHGFFRFIPIVSITALSVVSSVYEACSEIIETLALYPERTDVGKQNLA